MPIDISNIPIIDTHEHLVDESFRVSRENDILAMFLRHYVTTDLENAGLSGGKIEALRDPGQPLEKRWEALEPFWRKVSHTAYARALSIAVRDLYGVPHLDQGTIAEAGRRVADASQPGIYRKVLRKAGIETAIVHDLDGIYDPSLAYGLSIPRPSDPPGLFKKVIKGSDLLCLHNKTLFFEMVSAMGWRPVHSLQDFLDLIDSVFELSHEAVAVKFGHAYQRSLATSKPTYQAAEQAFNHLLFSASPEEWASSADMIPVEDYLIHHIIQEAIYHNLPIQIHTGLLEGGYNNLENSNPRLLLPLLSEYKEARFVLFHGGYPWTRDVIALGKMFPNVWLDLCWVWIISPRVGREMLHEMIETLPQNKVTAFGGDYIFIEGAYGHSVMARQNISRVLDEKVAEGWFGEDEACQYARAVLYENARLLYSR
jgi:uncharacterized protein